VRAVPQNRPCHRKRAPYNAYVFHSSDKRQIACSRTPHRIWTSVSFSVPPSCRLCFAIIPRPSNSLLFQLCLPGPCLFVLGALSCLQTAALPPQQYAGTARHTGCLPMPLPIFQRLASSSDARFSLCYVLLIMILDLTLNLDARGFVSPPPYISSAHPIWLSSNGRLTGGLYVLTHTHPRAASACLLSGCFGFLFQSTNHATRRPCLQLVLAFLLAD
jgi:hypothetical protein